METLEHNIEYSVEVENKQEAEKLSQIANDRQCVGTYRAITKYMVIIEGKAGDIRNVLYVYDFKKRQTP